MEKKIVVSKRFRKNTSKVYDNLMKENSAKTAFDFLNKLQRRVEINYPVSPNWSKHIKVLLAQCFVV